MANSDQTPDPDDERGITRGDLLKGAAAAGVVAFGSQAAPAAARTRPARKVAGMNILVFLTDQERAVQHFPPDWTKHNMPGLTRMQNHGLTFENAFTNACMCSPARSTFM